MAHDGGPHASSRRDDGQACGPGSRAAQRGERRSAGRTSEPASGRGRHERRPAGSRARTARGRGRRDGAETARRAAPPGRRPRRATGCHLARGQSLRFGRPVRHRRGVRWGERGGALRVAPLLGRVPSRPPARALAGLAHAESVAGRSGGRRRRLVPLWPRAVDPPHDRALPRALHPGRRRRGPLWRRRRHHQSSPHAGAGRAAGRRGGDVRSGGGKEEGRRRARALPASPTLTPPLSQSP